MYLVRSCKDVASSIARHLAQTGRAPGTFAGYTGFAELHAATLLLPPRQLEHVEHTVDPDPAAFVVRTWALAAAASPETRALEFAARTSPPGGRPEDDSALAALLREDPLPPLPQLSEDSKRAAGFDLWPAWYDKAVDCSAYEPSSSSCATAPPLPPAFEDEVRRHLPVMEAFMGYIVKGRFEVGFSPLAS